MVMPDSYSMPLTAETTTASGDRKGAARRMTSRTEWLGTAQITNSRSRSAASRSSLACTDPGASRSLR